MSNIDKYLKKVYKIKIDWSRLAVHDYQQEIAEKLKESFSEVYGRPSVKSKDCTGDYGFAAVPAYVKANNGDIYLGLLKINVSENARHDGTQFILPGRGFVWQEELTELEQKKIVPYKYRPLVDIQTDPCKDAYF